TLIVHDHTAVAVNLHVRGNILGTDLAAGDLLPQAARIGAAVARDFHQGGRGVERAVDGERAVAGNLHGAGIGRILPVDHAGVWTGIGQGLQVNQAAGVALEIEPGVGIWTHIDHHAPGGALVI